MGRILIVLGILMLAVGFILPITSMLNVVGDMTMQAVVGADAAQFCNAGEQLDTTSETVPHSRQDSASTTAQSIRYFCVSDEGRREVTESVVLDTLGDVGGGLGGLLTGGLATAGLSLSGTLLIIVGIIMVRGGNKPVEVVGAQNPFPGSGPVNAGGNRQQIFHNIEQNYGGQGANSVVNFMRDQLDTAYRNGQISREDYDRAVDKLNQR